jgi:hypothetical protein
MSWDTILALVILMISTGTTLSLMIVATEDATVSLQEQPYQREKHP